MPTKVYEKSVCEVQMNVFTKCSIPFACTTFEESASVCSVIFAGTIVPFSKVFYISFFVYLPLP